MGGLGMYKELQDFVSIVKRANQKGAKDVRISIEDANNLHAALSQLLLEHNENEKVNNRVIDGGRFK